MSSQSIDICGHGEREHTSRSGWVCVQCLERGHGKQREVERWRGRPRYARGEHNCHSHLHITSPSLFPRRGCPPIFLTCPPPSLCCCCCFFSSSAAVVAACCNLACLLCEKRTKKGISLSGQERVHLTFRLSPQSLRTPKHW